jgi:hypothetical protein
VLTYFVGALAAVGLSWYLLSNSEPEPTSIKLKRRITRQI